MNGRKPGMCGLIARNRARKIPGEWSSLASRAQWFNRRGHRRPWTRRRQWQTDKEAASRLRSVTLQTVGPLSNIYGPTGVCGSHEQTDCHAVHGCDRLPAETRGRTANSQVRCVVDMTALLTPALELAPLIVLLRTRMARPRKPRVETAPTPWRTWDHKEACTVLRSLRRFVTSSSRP